MGMKGDVDELGPSLASFRSFPSISSCVLFPIDTARVYEF